MNTRTLRQINRLDFIGALLLIVATVPLVSPQLRADSGVNAQAPASIITETVDTIMTRLKTDAAQLQGNPEALHALVSEVVVPHLDIPRISRMVLGKASRQADAATMARFSAEFRILLIRTYATSLNGFSGESVSFPTSEKQTENGKASVDLKIQRPGQAEIVMNFRMHNKSGPWLVYDIKIEGISLVASYRSEFAGIVRSQGLEALINLLRSKNSDVRVAAR